MDAAQILEDYHKWYYTTGVWQTTTFMGVRTEKSVSDMWNYQEILFNLQPALIIEFGTAHGGSTLFFSMILQNIRPNSKILTVDIKPDHISSLLRQNPHIEIMTCSSTEPKVQTKICMLRTKYKGPAFAILDSNHEKSHVLSEMELLRPLFKSGDYLVVEDSNINGHPVLPGWGEGPMEAIIAYFEKYPDDYIHDIQRENKFGFTCAPRGFLIRRDVALHQQDVENRQIQTELNEKIELVQRMEQTLSGRMAKLLRVLRNLNVFRGQWSYQDASWRGKILRFCAKTLWPQRVISQSGLFDPDYYLERNPEVAAFGGDPLTHFLRCGCKEGCNPSPFFDAAAYLQMYPDVQYADMNPLVHYLLYGQFEGRSPRPAPASDLQMAPDVR